MKTKRKIASYRMEEGVLELVKTASDMLHVSQGDIVNRCIKLNLTEVIKDHVNHIESLESSNAFQELAGKCVKMKQERSFKLAVAA